MTENKELQSLLQTIRNNCPMIEAEAAKLDNGQGDDRSLLYVEQLVHELAEAVSLATGNAGPAYDDGYEDGWDGGCEAGRDEGYEAGLDDGYEQGYEAAKGRLQHFPTAKTDTDQGAQK